MGQHFLADEDAACRIVEAAGLGSNDTVLEIGPGRGALTGHLLRTGARVVALELDSGLARSLRTAFAGRLEIVEGDALTVDYAQLLTPGSNRVTLVGNLPYRISGALLERILDHHALWRCAVVMVQREVARRITATPNGKDYGVLTIAAAIRSARRKLLFDVPPDAFDPPPKVFSSVVRLDFDGTAAVAVDDEQAFFRVVRAAFQQRRKKLRNALAPIAGQDAADEVLRRCGISADLRPENVSPEAFERVAAEMRRWKGTPDGECA